MSCARIENCWQLEKNKKKARILCFRRKTQISHFFEIYSEPQGIKVVETVLRWAIYPRFVICGRRHLITAKIILADSFESIKMHVVRSKLQLPKSWTQIFLIPLSSSKTYLKFLPPRVSESFKLLITSMSIADWCHDFFSKKKIFLNLFKTFRKNKVGTTKFFRKKSCRTCSSEKNF